MSNRNETIERLENLAKHAVHYVGEPPFVMSLDDGIALHDAIALLKAQEPVKPTRYQEGRWFKTWRCGACGGTLVFRNGIDKPKYCTDCGRAVKWE